MLIHIGLEIGSVQLNFGGDGMLVEAKDISISIGRRSVLERESVKCRSGAMTALVGPSGCGKTTLLHCLGLLLPVHEGKLLIDGKDVTKYNDRKRRIFWRDHAAFIMQDYGIMDEETVAFNVTMNAGIIRARVKDEQDRLDRALERTGLKNREHELAGYLSGGEKQRLSLARAIYKNAKILFVDEPTASLDEANRRMVIQLFKKYASRGRTVIVATHDEEMITSCDAVHRVGFGRKTVKNKEDDLDENNV